MSDRLFASLRLPRWLPTALLYATLSVGAALRIVVFFQNRSLYLDEANLARNIAERSGWEFFRPLDYHQFAPPLFSWLVKLPTYWLGNTEYALRLVPLLGGLAALWFFFRIAAKLDLPWVVRWWLVWLFAFQPELVRYSSECKQYGLDVFATTFLLLLALGKSEARFSWSDVGKWALVGAVVSWFSMPAVFILAGIGVYFLVRNHGDKHGIGRLLLVGGIWAASFLAYFFFLLKPDADSSFLQNYHDPWFFPLLPDAPADWRRAGDLLAGLLKPATGYTALAVGAGFLGMLAAGYGFFRKKESRGLLLALPFLCTLLASGLQYYSLLSRLTLFLVPITLLWIGWGFGWLWRLPSIFPRLALCILMALTAGLRPTFIHFSTPYQIEEVRPALAYVKERQQAGERVFAWRWAAPAYHFYSTHHPDKEAYQLQHVTANEGDFPVDWARLKAQAPDSAAIWIIYTHLISTFELEKRDEELQYISKDHAVEKVFRSEGTEVYRAYPR